MSYSGHRNRWNLLNHQSQDTELTPETQKQLPLSTDSTGDLQNLDYSCVHLTGLRKQLGHHPFRRFQDSIRLRPFGRASLCCGDNPKCRTCGLVTPQLYSCVHCTIIACRAHVLHHSEETLHLVAVDVNRAELFCCACNDQVYDHDFDAVVVGVAVGDAPLPLLENPRKRRRVDYKPWIPDINERALIDENSSPLPPSQLGGDQLPFGLRGLNNLGSTCFMNSVLQALLHTPPLRNYFLSDKHNRFYCERDNRTIVTRKTDMSKDNKNAQLCLACDLDAIFTAVFSGNNLPYSPAKFLYSWWQHASNLASYEQQDAHEFFISILDGIHEKMQKDRHKPHGQGSGDCCIAHRVFSGILRSDVMCISCGFTSTTYDPCVDISLDLEPHLLGSTKPTSRSFTSNQGGESTSSGPNATFTTLLGCLDLYTKPERLGSDQKFFCQQCQLRQECLKQMSIRKLPLVSCFHIKRFEHSSIRKRSRKIDRYLQFPFSVDMAPYLSSAILRSRYGNRILPDDQDFSRESASSLSELFAVIAHSGKLDAGHYVTYLRLSNQWYKCDDAWITKVNDDAVRVAQAYMLFYVQKTLYYRASEGVAAT